MGEIGAGGGSDYPGSLDTNTTLEIDSPSSSKTLARADVPNDLAAAVVAIQTELGTTPSGTATDVKTFLQVEHETNGKHWVVSSKAANFTVASTDTWTFYKCDTSSASITATLPSASSAGSGFVLGFTKTSGSNSLILDGNASETIDGSTTLTKTGANQGFWIICDGSNWFTLTPGLLGKLVEDIDVNGNSIISSSNGNISITPNGTGDVILDGIKYPQVDGSNEQVLQTNGSGQLSFAYLGVVQVIQTVKTDTASTTATSYTDIPGLSVTITPKSTSNKVFIIAHITATSAGNAFCRILRGSTPIYVGDTAGSRTSASMRAITMGMVVYLDSPATTSATTYKIQWITGGSQTAYLNQDTVDDNVATSGRTASSITAIEIGV